MQIECGCSATATSDAFMHRYCVAEGRKRIHALSQSVASPWSPSLHRLRCGWLRRRSLCRGLRRFVRRLPSLLCGVRLLVPVHHRLLGMPCCTWETAGPRTTRGFSLISQRPERGQCPWPCPSGEVRRIPAALRCRYARWSVSTRPHSQRRPATRRPITAAKSCLNAGGVVRASSPTSI
jgi:hypothetical protein